LIVRAAGIDTGILFSEGKEPMRYVVSAAIVDPKSKKLLLAKRSKDTTYPGLWCTPGGSVEDETQLEALRREVREEILVRLNIDAVGEVVYRHEVRSTRSGEMVAVVCYLVPIDAIEGTPMPGDKTEEVRWFSSDELSGIAMTPADEANYSALVSLLA
jgi:8-oxo-dGTP pyrophosphatase MutT (NUDIX family)